MEQNFVWSNSYYQNVKLQQSYNSAVKYKCQTQFVSAEICLQIQGKTTLFDPVSLPYNILNLPGPVFDNVVNLIIKSSCLMSSDSAEICVNLD